MKPLFVLVALISLNACAEYQYNDPIYLGKKDVDYMKVMPTVPVRGDKTDQADFAKLFGYQKSRSKAECIRSQSIVDVKLKTLYGKPYGPLTDLEVAKLDALFDQIRIDTDYFVQEGKKATKRLRPYLFNPKIEPCITKEITFAYPSGHTAISKVFALFLSEIYPERKDAFMKRADEIAEDRVRGGVHHPSDLVAGRGLADTVYVKLKANTPFKAAFAKIK